MRVLRLEVSVYNVYITNQFQLTFAGRVHVQIVSAQIVSGTNCIGTNCIGNKLYREQTVSGTNCIGHKLYLVTNCIRAQIVSGHKLYRGTNYIGPKLYEGA